MSLKIVKLLCAAAACVLSGAVNVAYTDCGSKVISIKSITANVWPPVQGASLTLTMSGTSNAAVTAGTFTQTDYYSGIQVQQTNGDLATIVHLPVATGPVEISSTSTFPTGLPAGGYSVTLATKDASNNSVFCVSLAFDEVALA